MACVTPFTVSGIYHIFLCHKSGIHIYRKLLHLDMLGVWVTNALGYIIPIWTTFYCSNSIRTLYLAVYLGISAVVLYYLLVARSAKYRFIPLGSYAILRPLILIMRVWKGNKSGYWHATFYYFMMDLFAFSGATVNVTRVPERFMPGSFDFFFNSHQLMHICVMVAIWCLNNGVTLDMEWQASTKCTY